MPPLEILETCLYVDDLAAAREFYARVLGLELVGEQPGRHVFFRCGGRMLLLFRPEASRLPNGEPPPHGAVGPGHAAFAIRESELPAWRARLERERVTLEKELAWPQGGCSLYFRDPAGNSLELATPRIWGLRDEETLGGERGPSPSA